MALYPEVVLVALSSAACSEALLSPVARLVCRMLVLANQDFTLGKMHAQVRVMVSRSANRGSVEAQTT